MTLVRFTGMRNLVSELDYRDGDQEERFDIYGTAERLNDYKNLISVGQPMEGISQLGGLDRQLLQETEFHSSGKTVLKKLSAEEVAEKETFNFQKLPYKLKEIVAKLDQKDINIGALMEVIRAANGDEKVLEWITLNWEEYVELEEFEPGAMLQLKDCEEEREDGNSPTVEVSLPPPPRDRYSVVEVFRPNQFKEASERRIAHLKARLTEIDQLYLVSQLLAYFDQARPTYMEDEALLESWSLRRRAEDRRHYLNSLRSQGLDFESIRRKLWATFDRVAENQIVKTELAEPLRTNWMKDYNPKEKREPTKDLIVVTTQTKSIKPPIWEIEKSKAFCELHQTRGQWRKIERLIWKQMGKAILLLASKALTEEARNEVRMLLTQYQDRLGPETVSLIASSLCNADEVAVCVM